MFIDLVVVFVVWTHCSFFMTILHMINAEFSHIDKCTITNHAGWLTFRLNL